jgi:hypothetical protein
VTTGKGCEWPPSRANKETATITSPPSSTGNATINYNVVVNAAFSQRSVSLTIGGQIFTIARTARARR